MLRCKRKPWKSCNRNVNKMNNFDLHKNVKLMRRNFQRKLAWKRSVWNYTSSLKKIVTAQLKSLRNPRRSNLSANVPRKKSLSKLNLQSLRKLSLKPRLKRKMNHLKRKRSSSHLVKSLNYPKPPLTLTARMIKFRLSRKSKLSFLTTSESSQPFPVPTKP